MPITINGVRFSYCSLFQPKPPINNPAGEPKYSCTILVPKTNHAAKAAIDQAIQQAIDAGVSKCWNGVKPPAPAICVHDGDGPRPSDGSAFGEECRGMWVFTASSKQAPFVVDAQVQNIIDPTQVYSGMWGNVNVNFFPYSHAGKKGIGCGLNGVQKTQDGDPLGGHISAQEAFGPVSGAVPAAPVPSAPAAPATPAYGAATPATPGAAGYTPAPVPGYAPQQVTPAQAPAMTGWGYPQPGAAPQASNCSPEQVWPIDGPLPF